MGDYRIDWNGPDRQFTWTDAAGNDHRETMSRGDQREFHGDVAACDLLNFIDAATAGGSSYTAANQGAQYASLMQACIGQVVDSVLGEEERGHVAPTPPPAEPQATGPETRPPPSSSAPPETNPPDPQPDIQASHEGGDSDGRTPEAQYHDRDQRSDDELADDLADRGVPPEEIEAELERIRRNDPTPGLPHFYFGRNDTTHRRTAADPVDLFSGTFGLHVVDVAIRTRGAVPLQIARTYRSGMPYYGPWGYNWDHAYNAYARPLEDGSVAVWTGRLSEDVYRLQGDGTFEPPIGVFCRLDYQAATPGSPERYVLADRDGIVEIFERPAGWPLADRVPMIRIEDRDHAGQDLTYDAEGRVATVRDHAQRGFDFAYGSCGLLESISDHTGRRWTYYHDSDNAHLVAVVGPPTLEAPDGIVTQYEYAVTEAHPLLRHNMIRIVDAQERTIVYNEYGSDPSSDDFARVVAQEWGSSRADFRATTLQDLPRIASAINIAAHRVEVIVDGQYRVHTFNFRGDLLDERCRLIRDSSYRMWARVYEYDHRGNQTFAREPDGLTLRRELDADNPDPRARQNVLRVVRESAPTAAVPARVLFEATYEPVLFQLSRLRDEDGNETRVIYDHEELPHGVGNIIRIEHPSTALPDGTPQQRIERYEYDGDGQLVWTRLDGGRTVAYAYGPAGAVDHGWLRSTIRDPDGLALTDTHQYDAWGHATVVLDGLGRGDRMTYDAAGLLRRVQLAAGGEVAYEYDRSGHLRRIRTPRGAYRDDGVIHDPFIAHELEHDELGHLVAEVFAANTVRPRRWAYRHDAWDRVVEIRDPLGRMTRNAYDERGCLLEVRATPPGGPERTIRHVYDRNGNRTATIAPGERRTELAYDAWGRVETVRAPGVGGVVTETAYGYTRNDLLAACTVRGVPRPGAAPVTLFASEIHYDARGRAVSVTRGGSLATVWWSVDDDAVKQVDVAGGEVVHAYDAAGRLVALTDPVGNVIAFDHDAADQVIAIRRDEVLAAGGRIITTTTSDYDAGGRVVRRTDPRGASTTTDYDERGLAIRVTDPLGNQVEVDHDAFGDIVAHRWLSTGAACAWQRDDRGLVAAYVDPLGAVTAYGYDGHDELIATRYPDGSSDAREYTATGDPLREVAADGTVTTYTIDAAGRPSRIDYAVGAAVAPTPSITLAYDGLGRVVRAEQGAIVVEREYDLLDRVSAETIDGRRCELRRDDPGRRISVGYPDGRRDLVALDPLRRPISIELQAVGAAAATAGLAPGTTLVEYRYDGVNRPATRRLWNGVAAEMEYDAALRLHAITHRDSAGAAIVRLENVYDAAGQRRLELATGTAPWQSRWIAVDPRARTTGIVENPALPAGPLPVTVGDVAAYLAALGVPAGDVAWRYDLDDADARTRVRRSDALGTDDTTYLGNALRQIVSTDTTRPDGTHAIAAFAYDGSGRRRSDGAHRYVHDARGLLVQIEDTAGGVLARLGRDAFGRVVVVDEPGAPLERAAWIGGSRLHADLPGGRVVQRSWSALEPELAVVSDGANRWVAQDQRWSSLVLGDSAGSVIERHSFDAYGAPRVWNAAGTAAVAVPAAQLRPRFAGYDLIGGIYVGPVRALDASTGSFLERDPEGYGDSSTLYAYAADNPIDHVDLTSRWVESAWDLFSLGLGVYSAVQDFREGRWGWFALDCVGIVLDVAALILPLVPGGVGAAVKAFRAGTAAVEVGNNAWRTGRIVHGTVDVGRLAYRAETVVRTGRAIEQTISVGQGAYNSYDAFSHDQYGSGMLYLGMTALGARGMMANWYNLPRAMRPLRAAETAFFPAGVRYPRYDHLPSRAFGDRARLLFSSANGYRWRNLIFDNREFALVSQQYWRGAASGLSLQHTWMMNSSRWPRGLRNAGLNFVEVSQRLNSWMGDNPWRNRAFRLQVATYLGVAATASYQTADELTNLIAGNHPPGASGTK